MKTCRICGCYSEDHVATCPYCGVHFPAPVPVAPPAEPTPEIPPKDPEVVKHPKTRVCLLYCTVLSTLLTFSGKKLTQGFSLLHMKGMFQLKPL